MNWYCLPSSTITLEAIDLVCTAPSIPARRRLAFVDVICAILPGPTGRTRTTIRSETVGAGGTVTAVPTETFIDVSLTVGTLPTDGAATGVTIGTVLASPLVLTGVRCTLVNVDGTSRS